MLVTFFVFAQLDYFNAVFTGPSRCDRNRLQSIQNAAVRLIAGAKKFDHVTPYESDHGCRLKTHNIQTECHDVNGIAPSYLQEHVINLPSSRCSLRRRSADTGQLYVPRTRTILGERAYAVAAPRA